ncbi:MAG: hypothetical protein AAF206_04910 [Bacteroidota bacterium]
MEPQSFSPRESLDLIANVLQEAKERQEQNGVVYIFWGLLLTAVGLLHYYVQSVQMFQWIFGIYLLIPVGVAVTYFAFPQYRMRSGPNLIGRAIGILWAFASVNMIILGFALSMELGKFLIPFILILKGIALGLSGFLLRYRPLVMAGIVANLVGMLGFWVAWEYHPLLMAFVSIFSVFLPGVLLNRAYIARKHV